MVKLLTRFFMLSRDSSHSDYEIFQGSLRSLFFDWFTVHESVKGLGLRHQDVGTAQDAEDAKGPDPDSYDRDNVGPVLGPPAKEGETSGDNVDNQYCAGQLPRRQRGPEWTFGSGDENQPVFGQGDLKEQDAVNGTKVLDDTALLHEHGGQGDPSTNGRMGRCRRQWRGWPRRQRWQ